MFIKFKILRYRNFLSTGNAWTEIYFGVHEKTLVCGENGAGKTTILDALTFALFKKAFRNINKPLLVNSINGQDCVVELEFEIGSIQYKIIRGIKPEIFEIYVNGKMIDQNSGIHDYQDVLEKTILKFNFKTFKQIMVLGSKSFVPFMQLPALDRRNVIEELLDIQIFSAMAKVVRNKLDHVREIITDLDRKVSVVQEKIDLQKANLQKNAEQNQAKIDGNLQEIKTNQSYIKQYSLGIKNTQSLINDMMVKITDLGKIQNKLNQLTKLETQMGANKNKLQKENDFLTNNSFCPTCKQDITDSFKHNQSEIHKNKLQELHSGLAKIAEVIQETKNKLDGINEILKQINIHQTGIQMDQQKIQQLNVWIKKLEKENEELANISTNVTDDHMDQFVRDLDELNSDLTKTKLQKRYLEVSAMMLKDGGIKTSIIKQYLPIMNNFINKYLSLMDFFANFTLNENFEESIMARHRDKFAYESFSEGEKLRIDLALLFAWRSVAKVKNSVDTNILIMDEIIDSSLDQSGIDDFFRLLSAFKETNIFVISPKGDILADKFDYVIRFEKKGDFSEIV